MDLDWVFLVDDCLIDEDGELLTDVEVGVRADLGHDDSDDVFDGIDPEVGAECAAPSERAV